MKQWTEEEAPERLEDALIQENEQLRKLVRDLHAWITERLPKSYRVNGKKIREQVKALGLDKENES